MRWPYRTYRPERAGETDWKRIFAVPMLAGLGVAIYARPRAATMAFHPEDVRPGQSPFWIAFSLLLLGAQLVYCCLDEFSVRGVCFSAVCLGAAALWGVDLAQE
jgi:hypothetical protein